MSQIFIQHIGHMHALLQSFRLQPYSETPAVPFLHIGDRPVASPSRVDLLHELNVAKAMTRVYASPSLRHGVGESSLRKQVPVIPSNDNGYKHYD